MRNFETVATILHSDEVIGQIRKRGNSEFVFFIPPIKTEQYHRPFRRSGIVKTKEEAIERAKQYLTKKYDINVTIQSL